MTGVGIGIWNQLLVSGLPQKCAPHPLRVTDSTAYSASTIVPCTRIPALRAMIFSSFFVMSSKHQHFSHAVRIRYQDASTNLEPLPKFRCRVEGKPEHKTPAGRGFSCSM